MREGITVEVSEADRGRLEAIVADRNSPQKHVWRARIVVLTADGLGTGEIMRQTGTSKVTVWRWQERFMAIGAARLCAEAKDGQILLSQRINAELKGSIATEQIGALALKGLTQPVLAYNVPVGGQGAFRVIEGGAPNA